jgi:hypothetical protein
MFLLPGTWRGDEGRVTGDVRPMELGRLVV